MNTQTLRSYISKARSMSVLLALAVGVSAAAPSQAAASTLTGWGVRGDSSFMGTVKQDSTGALSGHFTIVVTAPGQDPVLCRYYKFKAHYNNSVAPFDGYGTCWTGGNKFDAANRFAIGDYGSPGAGVDYIDVNYYGPVGVSIGGGFFDDGDITVIP